MNRHRRLLCALLFGVSLLASAGCHSAGKGSTRGSSSGRGKSEPIRNVVCLFDQKPWINADAQGDRDPEGIRYRVFLDDGKGKGVLRDGEFRIEMYEIGRDATSGQMKRTLVSDWVYGTDKFRTVEAKVLGKGYHLALRWAKKGVVGREIELITLFEDPEGNIARSGTRRLRVPKYES